jgi:hypothetical protein
MKAKAKMTPEVPMKNASLPVLALLLGAAFPPDERADLLAAAKRAAEVRSYAFQGETKVSFPEAMGKFGVSDAVKFEGRHDRDVGTLLHTDLYEFAIVDGKTAVRPLPEWRPVKEEDEGEIQRGLLRGLAATRPIRAPHADFATYAKRVVRAKKAGAKESVGDRECEIYEAEFTEEGAREAAKSILPMARWIDRLQSTMTSSERVWIDSDGRILKVETSAKVSATVQGTDMEFTATRTAILSGFDATKVVIPEAAKKVLAGK